MSKSKNKNEILKYTMTDPNLVTTCTFKGREYLVKLNIINNASLDLLITDKCTGEDWQCFYDVAYIENLTHRTGNFKQFHIFTTMLKSGLLKTSNCVSLDLLTFEDLEVLRSRRMKTCTHSATSVGSFQTSSNNKRYLILTYSVEFDRIHYPLPLEYCGPPDPQILQANIRRLEHELVKLQDYIAVNNIQELQTRVETLTKENKELRREIKRLNHQAEHITKSNYPISHIQDAIKNLEDSVYSERLSHNKLVKQLQQDKDIMRNELKMLQEKIISSNSQATSAVGSKPSSRVSDTCLSKLLEKKNKFQHEKAHEPVPKIYQNQRTRSNSPRGSKLEGWGDLLHKHEVPNVPSVPLNRRRSSKRKSNEKTVASEILFPSKSVNERTNRSRRRSRSTSECSCRSRNSSLNSNRGNRQGIKLTRSINKRTTTPREVPSKSSEIDYGNLESRIYALQRALCDGLNLQ